MGRKKKYLTKEEKYQSHLIQMMKYYWKNQDLLKKKNLENYYKNKKNKYDTKELLD